MAFQLPACTLCKYISEYINREMTSGLKIVVKGITDPDERNRMIDVSVNKYQTDNQLYDVYNDLYDELKPKFKKYTCRSDTVLDKLADIAHNFSGMG